MSTDEYRFHGVPPNAMNNIPAQTLAHAPHSKNLALTLQPSLHPTAPLQALSVARVLTTVCCCHDRAPPII